MAPEIFFFRELTEPECDHDFASLGWPGHKRSGKEKMLGRADDSGEGVENISSEQLQEVMGRERTLFKILVC